MSEKAEYAVKVCCCGFIFGMLYAIQNTSQQTLVFAILYSVLWIVVGAVASIIFFAALDALCKKYGKIAFPLCLIICVIVGTLCIYSGYKL
jgi:peptidoglycan/LPS O-acetylase OafA/YrhL